MQLLKQVPKDILSFTTFQLILSVTCYLIKATISFFNFDVLAPLWQLNDQPASGTSLEPQNSLIMPLLRNLRGLMMNSYHLYFDFMGMMLILSILKVLSQFSRKYLAKAHSMVPSETQQDQESEKSLPITSSQSMSNKYLPKALQCLLYFTVSYCLIESLDSSRSLLVGAKNIPIQKDSALSYLEQNQFHSRLLEEEEEFQQEILSDLAPLQDDLLDRLPTIKKTRGAISAVTSSDGDKVFQIYKVGTGYEAEYVLFGMDISDPSAIKSFPQVDLEYTRTEITLVLSSDSKTLFVITWGEFRVYNISHTYSPPKYVSTTRIPRNDSSTKLKPAAVLHEEKNILIIVNNNLHIFNVSDYNQPVHVSWYPIVWIKPASIALLPGREMVLVGSQEGLRAFDISDPENPLMRKRILENEFVFSISVTSNQSTAILGILNKNKTEEQRREDAGTWSASLSIILVDLENVGSSLLPYCSLLSIDQLKTCRVWKSSENDFRFISDIKMTPDSKYAYWACDKDYGYVDIEKKRVSRLLAQRTINAIALARDSKILLKVDSDETSLLALYQNIQKDDAFIWKPTSIAQLKINPVSQVVTSKSDRMVYVINTSTLQIYNTSENTFSLEFQQ